MNRWVLDTSAYSNFQRGHTEVARALDAAPWVGVPTITLGELETGFRLGARLLENQERLAEFLSNEVVETLVPDQHVAQLYADIVVDLRNRGRPVPTNDIWIAACAVRAGASVLTFDAHFAEITRVGSTILD